MIEVRRVTDADFETIQGWAERRGCGLVRSLLPPDGFVATENGAPILSCWVTKTNTPMLLVDHVYLPRRFNIESVRTGFQLLLAAVKGFAKKASEESPFPFLFVEIVMNPVMEREAKSLGGIISSRLYKKCHLIL